MYCLQVCTIKSFLSKCESACEGFDDPQRYFNVL